METVRLLERRAAALTIDDNDGKSPADIAKDNDHSEIVNYLDGRVYFARTEVR